VGDPPLVLAYNVDEHSLASSSNQKDKNSFIFLL